MNCVSLTPFFQAKHCHKVSWMHPRSKQWHQLDFIISRRKHLKNILHTRSYHSADCDTDHALILSKVRFQYQRTCRTKHSPQPKIATATTQDPEKCLAFQNLMQDVEVLPENGAVAYWDELKQKIHEAAISTFGKKVHPKNDWFDASYGIINPSISEKRDAYKRYKVHPTKTNLIRYREARNQTQKLARFCANHYWQQLCQDIQSAADSGDIRRMYDGIRRATGCSVTRTAPLKSKEGEPITDKKQQMDRWREHYSELYSTINTVSETALGEIPNLT